MRRAIPHPLAVRRRRTDDPQRPLRASHSPINHSAVEPLERRNLFCGLHGGVGDLFDPTGRALGLVDDVAPAYVARVNFGPANAAAVPGYVPDAGGAFGQRVPSAPAYGWVGGGGDDINAADGGGAVPAEPIVARARQSRRSQDDRYDTFLVAPAAAAWELEVPDGVYAVRVAAGDARSVRGRFDVAVEGVGSSRVDLQACKLEYSIVSPK